MKKKIVIGLITILACTWTAVANGNCDQHGSYYGSECLSCLQAKADKIKKQNDDCNTWNDQSKETKYGQQTKKAKEAEAKYNTWCTN